MDHFEEEEQRRLGLVVIEGGAVAAFALLLVPGIEVAAQVVFFGLLRIEIEVAVPATGGELAFEQCLGRILGRREKDVIPCGLIGSEYHQAHRRRARRLDGDDGGRFGVLDFADLALFVVGGGIAAFTS